MKLLGYWRSSAAYRVRIALNLKGLDYENLSVHLVKNGGEQHQDEYKALNPAELVPTLIDGDLVLNQSSAILEYLDEKYPQSPLLPEAIEDKALVRAFAGDVASDIHPLNNLRVLQYLSGTLNVTDDEKAAWYSHWITTGFAGLEARLKKTAGKFCFGDTPTVADLCLIPQIYNAKRFNVDLSAFPTILAIDEHVKTVKAFVDAEPENQPDAV